MSHEITPSQTIGPYLRIGLTWDDGPYVVAEDTPGAVWIRGRLLDGSGDPVPDGLVETWQADPDGRFPGEGARDGFRGIGRCATDADGGFRILTLKPGPLPTSDGRVEAPHINVWVHARGILRHLVTRIYFADEAAANDADPVLAALPEPARRTALIAQPTADGYAFDIRLQGADETVFFRIER